MIAEARLQEEVDRFRQWADQYPLDKRSDWWAEEYPAWAQIDAAVLDYALETPPTSWTPEAINDVLYAVARDDERLALASLLCQRAPAFLYRLAEVALDRGERDATWQLAVQLGKSTLPPAGTEKLLLRIASDADEYVRRHALMVLARLGSAATEEIALAAWHQPHENQQWARMAALWSLHRIQSPRLEELLAQAEIDARPYLSDFAKRMRRGEIDE